MKTLLKNTVAILATISVLSACSKSSDSKAPVAGSPETKVEGSELVGSFQGVSIVCEDGTEVPKETKDLTNTTLTFNADGTFKLDTIINSSKTQEARQVSGKYSVSGDVLTLNKETDDYQGNIEKVIENVKSEGKYKLDGKDLTVTEAYIEGSSCPVDVATIYKYQRQEPQAPVTEQSPSPLPPDEVPSQGEVQP